MRRTVMLEAWQGIQHWAKRFRWEVKQKMQTAIYYKFLEDFYRMWSVEKEMQISFLSQVFILL